MLTPASLAAIARDSGPEVASRLAEYVRAMQDAADALAAPDPDLAHERAEIAKAQQEGK